MDRRWVHGKLFTDEYMKGVDEFMHFVKGKFSEDEEILCPCSRCLNQNYLHQSIVERHILLNGMDSTYTNWIHHGEELDIAVIEHQFDVHDNDNGSITGADLAEDHNTVDDRFEGLLEDLHTAAEEGRQDGENEDANPCDNESFLANVMKEARRQLYPGCTKFSKFSFVVKLLHLKSLYKISNSAFSAILKLLADAFPDCAIPKSYNDAKNLLKRLGLGYDSIHVTSYCVDSDDE